MKSNKVNKRFNIPMPFGKYKGMMLENVPPEYLMFIRRQQWCPRSILHFIEDNLEWIENKLR